jgi:hypothetical protein
MINPPPLYTAVLGIGRRKMPASGRDTGTTTKTLGAHCDARISTLRGAFGVLPIGSEVCVAHQHHLKIWEVFGPRVIIGEVVHSARASWCAFGFGPAPLQYYSSDISRS